LISNQQLDCLWLPEIQKPAEIRLGLPSHSNWVVTKQKWDFERESGTDYLEISGNHVCLNQPRN